MTRDDYLTHDPEIRAALHLMREGAAYFDRTLAALPDTHFSGASLLPGWTRRHVIAHVAYNAQALMRLIEWAATGVEKRMYESSEARSSQIDEGAALSASNLRALHKESADALESAWRALPDEAWRAPVRMASGPPFPATTTIWLRTREVRIHAVDLDSGASFADFPPPLVDRLLVDVVSSWRTRMSEEHIPNIILTPTDQGQPVGVGDLDDPAALRLRGSAVDLARWATGRSWLGVSVESGESVPAPPRWI